METNAKVRFENDQDFTDGTISMGEMLDKWVSTADEGTQRFYELEPKRDELTLGILLRVTK